MLKGKPGNWYQDEDIGGYFNSDGNLVVCEEYGLTDEDMDKYSIEVQNGLGFYDSNGAFVRYVLE